MTGVLLYQPNAKWRLGAALGAAALIHLAAIAVASIYPQAQPTEVLSPEPPTIDLEPASPPDDPTPPSDPVAPTPSLESTDKLFVDENPTPPPIRRQDMKRVAPIVKKSSTGPGSLSLSSAKVLALSAPRPEYPYEARRQKITGSGTVEMTVDPLTGRVTEASMSQSTGNTYLDNAALTGFRRWRFKPGTALKIRAPITFTLTGARF